MDLLDPTAVTLDPDATVQGATSDDNSDSPDCLLVHPTREALDYLEQALTTGISRPTYDGPIPPPAIPNGRYPIDLVFTLPLETPFHIAQSTSPLHLIWDCVNRNPESDPKTCSPSELTKAPANENRDSQVDATQSSKDLEKTTEAQSPPQGTFSRPKVHGILRNGSSSRTRDSKDPEAPGKSDAKAISRTKPSGSRRTVKFQLPQGEAESVPTKTVQARPRCLVTIKSQAAARKWQELEQRKKQVAKIPS